MPEDIIHNPNQYQHKILKGLAVAIGLFALALSLLNIYLEQYSLSALELILTLSCWFVYRQIQLNRLSYLQSLIIPYFVVLTVIWGTYLAPLQHGLFIWTFILPTIFYLLYGKQHGFWASLAIVTIQVFNILFKEDSELYSSERIATNFALAYITIWIVSRAYEISREKSHNALQKLALKDSLTNSYNRLALKQHFAETLFSNELRLVLIDIDFFKKINDQYGHEAGDFILQEFTKVLQNQAGEENVFRLGGEEFCLLLEKSQQEALQITEAIRTKILTSEFHYKNDLLKITFSAGIADFKNNQSLSELLAEADNNLYKAKNNGRNQIAVD